MDTPIVTGLRISPPLDAMEHDDLAALAATTTRRTTAKGDVLFNHGDTLHHVVLILNGWVKLSRSTLDGAEAVLDVMSTGHLVALHDMFGAGTHTSTATVVEAAEILLIPAPRLMAVLDRKPHLAMTFLRDMATTQNMLEQELEGRTLQKAPQRLGCFLLRLVPPSAQTGNKAPVTLQLPFDKTLLAARLGMQPETFSRALSKLKKDLGITVLGGSITIPNVQALVAHTCSACSGNFPCQPGCSGKTTCSTNTPHTTRPTILP